METMQHDQAPAWINLDALTSEDLRTDVAEAMDRLRSIMPTLENLGADARAAMRRADAARKAAHAEIEDADNMDLADGCNQLLAHLTGEAQLHALLNEAMDLMDPDAKDAKVLAVEVGALRLDGGAVERLQSVARRAPRIHAQAARLAREAWEALRPELVAEKDVAIEDATDAELAEFQELTGAKAVQKIAFDLMQAWLPASKVLPAEVCAAEWYDYADERLITAQP